MKRYSDAYTRIPLGQPDPVNCNPVGLPVAPGPTVGQRVLGLRAASRPASACLDRLDMTAPDRPSPWWRRIMAMLTTARRMAKKKAEHKARPKSNREV